MREKTANIAAAVMVINVLSRALALVANSLITASFGANALTSAYSFAITLAGIITTIIGTTLTTSVIPIYTELKETGDKKRTDAFLNNTISLTVIVSLSLIFVGILAAPLIAKIAGKGDYNFSVYATRVLLFSILFMSLYYIFSGILQANNRFFLAAAVSIPSSLCSMLYIFLLSQKYQVAGLVVATLVGYFAQAAILAPALSSVDYRFGLSFRYKNEDMFKIFRVVAPVIIGICAYQINILTNSSIAFRYDTENYIVLNNAQNLGIQIVMTMTLAIASVIYPKLSTLTAKKDESGFIELMTATLNGIILLLIPLTFGFFLLGRDFIDLIYGYGKFTEENVRLGGSVFSLYALGILGIGFKEITDRAFYARKNTRISALNGVVIMAVNILLSVIFVRIWGLGGIAAAYSAAALVGGANIIFLFKKKYGDLTLAPIAVTVIKAVCSAAVMIPVVILIGKALPAASKLMLLVRLAVSAAAGTVAYGIMLIILKTKEIINIINKGDRKNAD